MKKFNIFNRVGPLPFTADGTSYGVITVPSVLGLYLGQDVIVSSNNPALKSKQVRVKAILSLTTLQIGPRDDTSNYSAVDFYTVADGSTLEAAEQEKEVYRDNAYIPTSVFEPHPLAFIRTGLVDPFGQFYNPTNPVPVTVEWANNPTIVNLPVTLANTEVSITAPANTRRFLVRVRGGYAKLQMAFTSGASASNYVTIDRGSSHIESDIDADTLSIFLQSDKPNIVIEALFWNKI